MTRCTALFSLLTLVAAAPLHGAAPYDGVQIYRFTPEPMVELPPDFQIRMIEGLIRAIRRVDKDIRIYREGESVDATGRIVRVTGQVKEITFGNVVKGTLLGAIGGITAGASTLKVVIQFSELGASRQSVVHEFNVGKWAGEKTLNGSMSRLSDDIVRFAQKKSYVKEPL